MKIKRTLVYEASAERLSDLMARRVTWMRFDALLIEETEIEVIEHAEGEPDIVEQVGTVQNWVTEKDK